MGAGRVQNAHVDRDAADDEGFGTGWRAADDADPFDFRDPHEATGADGPDDGGGDDGPDAGFGGGEGLGTDGPDVLGAPGGSGAWLGGDDHGLHDAGPLDLRDDHEGEAAEVGGLGPLDGSGDWLDAGDTVYGIDPGDVASDTDLDLTGDGVVDGGDAHEAMTAWSHFQPDHHTL